MGKLVLGAEASHPATPDSGDVVLYFVGSVMYAKFDDGTQVKIGTLGGMGNADLARFGATN